MRTGSWARLARYVREELSANLADTVIALVWSDAARDLSSGPVGPWRSYQSKESSNISPFLPIVQYSPAGHKLRPPPRVVQPSAQVKASFTQSASLLGRTYGQSLVAGLMKKDSFHGLREVNRFSANFICQALNLIESVISENTGYSLMESENYSLDNLLYHQDILERLGDRLRETISDLQRQRDLPWPKLSHPDTQQVEADASARLLLLDFENLLARAQQLLKRCKSGMTINMNSAAIAESQKAISLRPSKCTSLRALPLCTSRCPSPPPSLE